MIRRPPRSTLFPYTDALPICSRPQVGGNGRPGGVCSVEPSQDHDPDEDRSEEHTSELQSLAYLVCRLLLEKKKKQRSCCCRRSPALLPSSRAARRARGPCALS